MFNDIRINRNSPMVFLGGTCNGSTWRDRLISKLKIEYFNPVVDDWTPAHMEIERKKRQEADYVLYVITPLMTGTFSIAELTEDSIKNPQKTVFCFLKEDGGKSFDESQIKSLQAVGELVKRNNATWLESLDEVSSYLNSGSLPAKAFMRLRKETE